MFIVNQFNQNKNLYIRFRDSLVTRSAIRMNRQQKYIDNGRQSNDNANSDGNYDQGSLCNIFDQDNKKQAQNQTERIQQNNIETEQALQNKNIWSKSKVLVAIILGMLIFQSIIVAIITQLVDKNPNQTALTTELTAIVQRNFLLGQVYHQQYVVTNQYQNFTTILVYDFTIAVCAQENNSTKFTGALLKKSQEKIQINGNSTFQLFNQDNVFLEILSSGGNGTNETYETNSTSSSNSSQSTQNSSLGNSTNTVELAKVLPIIQFSMGKDGKIQYYNFPILLDIQTLGLFRSAIKLFSPLNDKSAYTQQKTMSKRKVRFGSVIETSQRLGQQISLGNQSNNSTENQTLPDSVYEELNNYDFESSDDGISLSNIAQVSSQDSTHRTSEVHTQSNQFDENGRLLQGSQTSNTDFSSPDIPPDPNSSVINLNLNFSSKVSSEIKLILFFEALNENIQKFQGIFTHYQNRSQTLKVDPTGLVNYIIGLEQSNNSSQNVRLLLQADGSVSLLKYDKQVKIVQTNILGCKLGATGYMLLNFNLYQDSKQQFKKIPKFITQAGTFLKLGFKSFKHVIMHYEKQLPPLSLKFTLDQIQMVVNLIKGDFIGKLKEIWKLIVSGEFDNDLLPNILKVLDLAGQVSQAITTGQNQNTPTSIIQQIILITNQIKNAIDTQGMSLLDPQNQFTGKLSEQLLTFVNMSYSQALTVFNLAKSTFTGLKSEGSNFLIQMLENFIKNDSKIFQQRIKSLIPSDVYVQYENQMKIAKDVINFILIVKNNGTDYMNYIESTFVTQKTDFLKFIKGVVDLFFINQTIITDSSFDIIIERFSNVSGHINLFRQLVSNFNISKMHSRITDLFSTVLLPEFKTSQYLSEWNNRISELQNIANYVNLQKGGDPCCSWDRAFWPWESDQCDYYNNAYGDQMAEPQLFQGLSQGWTSLFKAYSQSIVDFISKSINIINDNNLPFNEKYEYIKQNYTQVSQLVTVNAINQLQGKINERIAGARNILSRVGCGGTGNLNLYITKLQSLNQFVNLFKSSFINLQTKAQNVISAYSTDVYSKLRDNFVIVQSVDHFLSNYEQKQSYTKSFITDLRNIVSSYNIQQFAKSNKIMNDVTVLYEKVKQGLGVVCQNSQQQKNIIGQIRKQYQNKLNTINSLSNALLNDQLNQIKQFLNKATNQIYEEYIKTSFCSHKQKFINQIATLNEDINNMTAIYTLYKNITKIIDKNKLYLSNITLRISILQDNFYRLFTPEGFRLFIVNTQKFTQQIKSFIYQVSIDYSTIKQEAQSIYVFQMAPKNNLTMALQFYTTSPFILKLTNVFDNISQFVNKSYEIVDKLSFDIITVVVIAKDVLEYFQQTVNNFKNGIQSIENQFKQLCQSFLNLQDTTGQEYINQINTNFQNLLSVVNQTIFPRVKQKMTALLNRYQSYRFSNRKMQSIKGKCFSQLSEFAQFIQSTKSKIFSKTNDTMNKIKQIIAKLEIGNLNQIYKLAVYIKDQFSSFLSYFRTVLNKISDYKNEVARDLRKLFKIGEFFDNIKNQIQGKYTQTVSNIKGKITQTLGYLQKTQSSSRLLTASNQVGSSASDFLTKLKNSTAFSNLEKVGEKLINNFTQIWNSLKQKQSKIKQFVQKISNESVQLIKELGSAKQKFSNITNRVQERVDRIKNQFQGVRRKLTNIQSLIFITLKAELGSTIKESMQNILKQIDDIFNIDFRVIQDVVNSTLKGKIPLIDEALDVALDAYTNLVPLRDKIFKNIFNGLEKIDQFLEDTVTKKMQKLKQGMVYIKSVVDNSENPMQIMLYNKQLYNVQVPIFKFRQPIVTAIGVFMISLDIDYRININAYIILQNFRSVQCKIVFEAALVIDLRFGYTIAYILQFGLFVAGDVLRGQVALILEFNNIVPLQLVKSVTDIAQISKSNQVTIDFAIELAIYAVELEVGFYIGHIWIQLIWIRIQICIDLLFFQFCISFRIPIGFRFIMKRYNFGFRIRGVEIVKKRIFDITLFKFNY